MPDLSEKSLDQTLAQLHALLAAPAESAAPRLSVSQVSIGSTIHMVPLRDVAGKTWLQLRGGTERLAVSRLYAQQFRAT